MNPSQKVAQYLDEAKASEDALVRVLQSQIAMTPDGSYRSALEQHLGETHDHARRVKARIRELGEDHDLLGRFVGLAEDMIGQSLALAKMPLDLMRGSGGEEKVLKNAKDAAATEALEIATYTAIEQLARSVQDAATEELARSIKADEERMLARIMREIPSLTDAVARAELEDDPSYDLARTGAADAARRAGAETRDLGLDVSESDLPIRGYDDLTAAEIISRLSGLSQNDLARIESFERAHQGRKTVLEQIDGLREAEPWAGYDELNVGEVAEALQTRSEQQVSAVRAYESSHKNRAGVIDAVDRRLDTDSSRHGT